MKDWLTLPNLISYFRVLLMFFGFWYFLMTYDTLIFLLLTIVVIALDALDGIAARKFDQASSLGAKVDIYCDRIVELAYWYFFAFINYIGIWVFWFFLIRGIAVDYITRKNDKPLGDSWLRSSRFMRASYGTLKALSFSMLIIMPNFNIGGINITILIVYLTVMVCFLRAWPVLTSYKSM